MKKLTHVLIVASLTSITLPALAGSHHGLYVYAVLVSCLVYQAQLLNPCTLRRVNQNFLSFK